MIRLEYPPRMDHGNFVQRAFLVKEVSEWAARVRNPQLTGRHWNQVYKEEFRQLRIAQAKRFAGVVAEAIAITGLWISPQLLG